MSSKSFGFEVEYDENGWNISLPWRDDRWRIDASDYLAEMSSHETALAAFDAFIAEAQRAREALVRGEGFSPRQP